MAVNTTEGWRYARSRHLQFLSPQHGPLWSVSTCCVNQKLDCKSLYQRFLSRSVCSPSIRKSLYISSLWEDGWEQSLRETAGKRKWKVNRLVDEVQFLGTNLWIASRLPFYLSLFKFLNRYAHTIGPPHHRNKEI